MNIESRLSSVEETAKQSEKCLIKVVERLKWHQYILIALVTADLGLKLNIF